MPDLRQTRKKIKTALVVMAAVDVLALVTYISPLVGSAESRRQQMNELQTELRTKTRQVEPLKNLPQKVVTAGKQITDFYGKRFPSQDSQIATEFGKLAAADGVTIGQAKYKVKDKKEDKEATPDKLQAVEMEADLSGSYASLARFINAIERDETFFIINSITLGGEQAGPVRLDMKLETYLKAGS